MTTNDVDRSQLSPMMKQYLDIKAQYPTELLFFRLGDFYELFFEDGIIAARELELTLTGKRAGLKERVPMCGVPFHSVKPYLEKLIAKGYRIAICEQLEDPKTAKQMVKRGVVEVISRGTITDDELLNRNDQNYIASILDLEYCYVITYADVSTGLLYSLTLNHDFNQLLNEVEALGFQEVILENNSAIFLINALKDKLGVEVTISKSYLKTGFESIINSVTSVQAQTGVRHLLYYLVVRQLKDMSHLEPVKVIDPQHYLQMDAATIRSLELTTTWRLSERTNSLIGLLDQTKTAMGSRCLKDWLLHPLRDQTAIEARYDQIETLNNEFIIKAELINNLKEVYDLERLSSKVSCGPIKARDLLQIKKSLAILPLIKQNIIDLKFNYQLETFPDLVQLLESSLIEDPPLSLQEGHLIKPGYHSQLDEWRLIQSQGQDFIVQFENKVRSETGIKTLKVGFNRIFGYYLEVSKGQINQIKPEFNWERKQTLVNCERYISPELKEKEALILNAEERIKALEYDLFGEIKDQVKKEVAKLKQAAHIISELDAICALAVVASSSNYVRPTFRTQGDLEIIKGRHPVLEKIGGIEFVPNDCLLKGEVRTLLITGPNMSGKSTYMRQVALIIIMAQMGSFVPAQKAVLPIIDRIFTRIGASDDIVGGESTFMVEMTEAQNAISKATSASLILFDELGRGTATYDGMSLAQAILEYSTDQIKCITLFSTHYHELTALTKKRKSIQNVHVEAYLENDELVFLHQVKPGAIDKSYGIQVAKLAQIPEPILKRATEILNQYEKKSPRRSLKSKPVQLALDFSASESQAYQLLITKLKEIDPLRITPLEAINLLFELKDKTPKSK